LLGYMKKDMPAEASLALVPTNPAPEGGRVAYFETSDKVRLRFAVWRRSAGPNKGTICLVHGRTEFIEKYFETIRDFQARGFCVATFDWRGQGGSERLIKNSAFGYVDHFNDYICDLRSFHSDILLPDCPPPFHLVGHSMGGLVALLAAAEDRMMFDRLFLSAPMLRPEGVSLSPAMAATLMGVLRFVGLGGMSVARRADKPMSEEAFAGNDLTSDLARYTRALDILKARPDLEVTAPSVSWAGAAFKAMAVAGANNFAARVRLPVLMLAAAQDRVVSTAAIESLGLRMRSGWHSVIAGARHELFMETDAVREQLLAAFDAFIAEQSTT
jgi:lysophospholipase